MARIGSSGCLCAKDSFRRPAACRFPKVQDPGKSPVRYSLQGQALERKLVEPRSNIRNRLWTACMFYSFQANNSNKPIASSILDQQIVVGLAQAASAKELRLNLCLHVEGHHSRIPLHALQPRSLKKTSILTMYYLETWRSTHQLRKSLLVIVIVLSALQLEKLEALTPRPDHVVQNARLLTAKEICAATAELLFVGV